MSKSFNFHIQVSKALPLPEAAEVPCLLPSHLNQMREEDGIFQKHLLKPMLVHFTPDFEMMPGTRPVKAAEPEMKTFEQEPPGRTDGG